MLKGVVISLFALPAFADDNVELVQTKPTRAGNREEQEPCTADTKFGGTAHWIGDGCKTLDECRDACAVGDCVAFNWWPEKGGCRHFSSRDTNQDSVTAWTSIGGSPTCTGAFAGPLDSTKCPNNYQTTTTTTGPLFADPSGGWVAFNSIFAANPNATAFNVTMRYEEGECRYNLFGNGCEGFDAENNICGGPCEVADDESTIHWTDHSGLAATNPVLQNQVWTKDAGCWGPFAPKGRKYSFSAELDLGEGPVDATFWLWQQ